MRTDDCDSETVQIGRNLDRLGRDLISRRKPSSAGPSAVGPSTPASPSSSRGWFAEPVDQVCCKVKAHRMSGPNPRAPALGPMLTCVLVDTGHLESLYRCTFSCCVVLVVVSCLLFFCLFFS